MKCSDKLKECEYSLRAELPYMYIYRCKNCSSIKHVEFDERTKKVKKITYRSE